MITTRSYYKGDISIANATDISPTSNLLGNSELLGSFIAKYERVCLLKCLGVSLYKQFKAQFDVDKVTGEWTLKSGADAKWSELLNGKEYTINGKDAIWKGVIYGDIDPSNPDTSFLSYFVYSKFIEVEELKNTGVGMVKDMSKNAVIQVARSKISYGYNEFVKLVQNECGPDKSLYGFLRDSNTLVADTYPNWEGESLEFINRFGL